MRGLYSSPLRVYLILSVLALCGIYSLTQLPISLFPNTSKPTLWVSIPYGSATPEEFLNTYGKYLEPQLRSISTESGDVDQIQAYYEASEVSYQVEFQWGTPFKLALKETQAVVQAFSARLPNEVRDGVEVNTYAKNAGFFALSFFSSKRSMDELYDLLEPLLTPRMLKIQDAAEPILYNPNKKQIHIELNFQKMATLGLFPMDVDRAIQPYLASQRGGSMMVGLNYSPITIPNKILSLQDFSQVLVTTPSQKKIHLSEVAQIDFGGDALNATVFKTSGHPSLILFSQPRPGGNIKKMSELMLAAVQDEAKNFPKDIEYRVLVDPSEFIRSAIHNVFHEVVIGAGLAVLVLFLFIGSLKNTITTAIEIPLSMILAFILMKWTGMNINLISLGGLALSAGMNVDASVVVMENIFRHFNEVKEDLDFQGKLKILIRAVKEVQFAVIASTTASLVVFLPLVFTSNLSYAILGDLAKTVVFSHGFSAIVALILVPTIRLHLMTKTSGKLSHHSPLEGALCKLEALYAFLLNQFIMRRKLKWGTYFILSALVISLVTFVLPRLPKEIIGTPDSDWMVVSLSTSGNSFIKQMESQTEETEARLLKEFGPKISYTFTQVRTPNNSRILARLKDKKEVHTLWKQMEKAFPNTARTQFWVGPWNPAELPIPDPAQMRIAIRGGDLKERAQLAREVSQTLEENQIFPRIWTEPSATRTEGIFVKPNLNLWKNPEILADLIRVATQGRKIGNLSLNGRDVPLFLDYPKNQLTQVSEIEALPILMGSKLIPLKAIAQVETHELTPTLYRENEQSLFLIYGKKDKGDVQDSKIALKKAQELVSKHQNSGGARLHFEDAEKDLNDALRQLAYALALSIGFIFLTMIFQFGSFINSFLVLMAIPLGLIGVLSSLFVFKSTLSLNSILGVILLNGIAVANSIILVDFIKRCVDEGLSPHQAALVAGRKRLRPILITTLTTILAMLPIALGMGEGGKILQPLGITVSGGLGVSTLLTLFIVPSLQVSLMQWREKKTSAQILTQGELPLGLKTAEQVRIFYEKNSRNL